MANRGPGQPRLPEEEGSDTAREAQCIPGDDPADINKCVGFIFLKKEATGKMRDAKKKVRYIFPDEEEIK